MDTNKSKAQMRKGIIEYGILLILQEDYMYASDMIKVLKDSGFLVVEGTLYPLLNRLKTSGYLTYKWVESTQGPPRKYYNITQEGKEFLKILEESWLELVNSINNLKEKN